ncbi:hypothetical protein Ccel01_17860 [Cellulosimicrobium cellulans]|uniref:Uncharacterized protein n=1 Tax=Cellulosimicrobium cellulans TaxID=1710 RepID=A0AAV5PA47_CELCE|nr:hypothetical protein Ccel01_17860 [Cellulosimicrobium cellulans]
MPRRTIESDGCRGQPSVVPDGHDHGSGSRRRRAARDEETRMHGTAGCEVAMAACSGALSPRTVTR